MPPPRILPNPSHKILVVRRTKPQGRFPSTRTRAVTSVQGRASTSGDWETLQHWCSLMGTGRPSGASAEFRSEEHTSELQSLMRISYAVFCLKKKKYTQQ